MSCFETALHRGVVCRLAGSEGCGALEAEGARGAHTPTLGVPASSPLCICVAAWSGLPPLQAEEKAAKAAELKKQRELEVRTPRLSCPALSLLCSVEWSAAQFPAQLRVPAQCRSVASEPAPESIVQCRSVASM